MAKHENLEQVAKVLGEGDPFNFDERFDTVGELIDALMALTNEDNLSSLKESLSTGFLSTPIEETNNDKFYSEFEQDIEKFLGAANQIIPRWENKPPVNGLDMEALQAYA